MFFIKSAFLIFIFLISQKIMAQSPDLMSYQAVVRNSGNIVVANQSVGVRISILKTSASGTEVFKESFSPNPTTNANGLLSLQIGSGTAITGTFAGIDWSAGPYFVKTEIDPTGGTNYTISGTSQLLSVPYALYAKTSGNSSAASNWGTSGINIYNTNTGKVGIGTNTPSTKFSVKSNDAGISQVSTDDVTSLGFFTDTNSAFVQTNTLDDLNFATGNSPAQMTLQKTTGNLGIGKTNPTEKLDVNGKTKTTNLQITNGAGKVLTSDATGNANWKDQNNYLFSVYNNSSTQVLVNGALSTDVKLNDIYTNESGAYNIVTKTFTAPKDGIYHFDVDLGINASNGTTNLGLVRIEISGTGSLPSGTTFNGYPFHVYQMPIRFLKDYGVNGINYSATLKMYAGFTYKLEITSPAGTHQIEVYRATFTGYLMKGL